MKFSQGAIEKFHDAESVEIAKEHKIIENHFMCDADSVTSCTEKDEGSSLTGSQVRLCKDEKVLQVLPPTSQEITEQGSETDMKVSGNLDEREEQEDSSADFFSDPEDSLADEDTTEKKIFFEKFNVMLDKSEMRKFYRIIANQKYGVPVNTHCVVINNNFLDRTGTKKQAPEDINDENFMSQDDKLDIIIYVIDDIWHMVHDFMNGRSNVYFNKSQEKMTKLEIKIKKLEDKLDAVLDKMQKVLDRKEDNSEE